MAGNLFVQAGAEALGVPLGRCCRPKVAFFDAALGMKCTYKKSYYGHSSEVGPFQKVVECEFDSQENRYLYIYIYRLIHLVSFTRGILTS